MPDVLEGPQEGSGHKAKVGEYRRSQRQNPLKVVRGKSLVTNDLEKLKEGL